MVLLFYALWLVQKTRAILSANQTNRHFVTRVFPRFEQFAYFDLEYSLARCAIFLSADWLQWQFWFLFYDTQSKRALNQLHVY